MNGEDFNTDRRGVSPVIGVILMVAITVVLSAVIATFAIGISDSLSTSVPQTAFDFQFEQDGNQNLSIQHIGGDSIPASELDIVSSEPFYPAPGNDTGTYASGKSPVVRYSLDSNANGDPWRSRDLIAGSEVTIVSASGSDLSESTVRVIYEDPDGRRSAILVRWSN
jgi:flagellin-like protein